MQAKAEQIAWRFLRERFLSPRSTEPMYVRWRPDAAAKASCDMPAVSRRARTAFPTARWMLSGSIQQISQG